MIQHVKKMPALVKNFRETVKYNTFHCSFFLETPKDPKPSKRAGGAENKEQGIACHNKINDRTE